MLGTYATFSAPAPLVRTEKVARRGGDKVKNNGAVALARKIVASLFAPFWNQILHKKPNKLLLL